MWRSVAAQVMQQRQQQQQQQQQQQELMASFIKPPRVAAVDLETHPD
jgi:hypothetical protein